MNAESLRRRCGAIAGLVPSALLLVLVTSGGCSGPSATPLRGLEQEFPRQAASILDAGSGFKVHEARFTPERRATGDWGLGRLRPELPANGEGDILFHLGAGQPVRVREIGASGPGSLVRRAVSYARTGGTTFWSATSGGVEEWLQLDEVRRGVPAASWEITGATLRAHGSAIELTAPGGARMRVTAPAAFASGGAPLASRLQVRGATIELYVDADAERVLVDPIWTLVASMPTSRYGHTAAVLGNGKVLVSGGAGSLVSALSSGAVYNPLAGTWAATAPMNVARSQHRASALGDGTALVTGGTDDFGVYQYSTEVYSGLTGAWVAKPDMIDSRANHSSTRLVDGRVLIAGGYNDYGGGGGSGGSGGAGAISNCELYDPNLAGGSWMPAGSMFSSRERHTATLLQNGTVLVAGGDNGVILSEAEIYDPATNAWSPTSSMYTAREDFTATLLLDGTVLVTGGFSDTGLESSAEIYDPGFQSWHYIPNMNTARVHHTATLLPSGAVLVAGGDNDGSFSSAEIYDPVSQSFTQVASMNDARTRHTATPIAGGGVLVAGGESGGALDSAEIFTLTPLGQACSFGIECVSGNCVNDVCCDTACDTLCFSCTAALKGAGMDGVCGPTEAGTPPSNGGGQPSVAGGPSTKSVVNVGGGPGTCFDDGAQSCGTNGLCDGAGSCQFYAAGTECAAAFCSEVDLVQADLCDGAGSCVVSGPISCDPGSCFESACDLSCAIDSDCNASGYCKVGTCTAKQADGVPAISANQCASGFLADGVCCDTDCAGPCVACTPLLKGGGVAGVCEAVIAGNDPDDDCADQGAASCGTNGSCNGNGACALYAGGAVCQASSCAGGSMVDASLCDGKGSCVAGGVIDCSPAMCVNGACAAVCVVDADCLGASYCGAGTCAAKKTEGLPAAGGNECLSAFAADGVCCNVACDAGPCDGCSVAAGAQKDGACVTFTGPSCEDGDPCSQGETCLKGICQGGGPVVCPALDVCHDPGSCDAETGSCLPIAKPDGSPCDDGNPCTADGCVAGTCASTHLLDGSSCPGGICIAGGCVLDTNVMTGSTSSGSTSSSTSGGTTGSTTGGSTTSSSGGAGGEGGGDGTDTGELVGSGCSTGGAPSTTGGPAGLLLALLGFFRRRRAPAARR